MVICLPSLMLYLNHRRNTSSPTCVRTFSYLFSLFVSNVYTIALAASWLGSMHSPQSTMIFVTEHRTTEYAQSRNEPSKTLTATGLCYLQKHFFVYSPIVLAHVPALDLAINMCKELTSQPVNQSPSHLVNQPITINIHHKYLFHYAHRDTNVHSYLWLKYSSPHSCR